MDELFELISGYLYITKKVFIKDLLLKNSYLRQLINSSEPRSIDPQIKKEKDTVKIIFDNATDIDLDENYKQYFQKLKSKYGADLKGRVVIRVTCYATFSSIVDFNKADDKIFVY